jgi:hypothetical protein
LRRRTAAAPGVAGVVALTSSALAYVFGMVAMAVFASLDRDFSVVLVKDTYSLGAGFGLCVISWLIHVVAVVCFVAALFFVDGSKGYSPAAQDMARL